MCKKRKIHIDLDTFFDDAVEAKEFNEVTKQIIEEENKKLINETRLKRDETWSYLANQVVGAERFRSNS